MALVGRAGTTKALIESPPWVNDVANTQTRSPRDATDAQVCLLAQRWMDNYEQNTHI